MKQIKVTVEKTHTGFSAGADKYPVYTAGNSLEEIKRNMAEALNLYFEYKALPAITTDNIRLILDLASFFDFYKVINAKALSERIGMNQSLLAQYISGTKKPSVVQTRRILKGVQQIGKELAEMQFLL